MVVVFLLKRTEKSLLTQFLCLLAPPFNVIRLNGDTRFNILDRARKRVLLWELRDAFPLPKLNIYKITT
jgi:hypothetical protein